MTTPEGRRVGFTYREEKIPLFSLAPGCWEVFTGFFGDMNFRPYFDPDPGVYETLEIDLKTVGRGGLSDIFGATRNGN